MILIFLVIVKLYFLIMFKLFYKTNIKANKIYIYVKKPLLSANLSYINNNKLNNLIININKQNINNFKLFFNKGKFGYYIKSKEYYIKIINNNIVIVCNKTSKITVVLYALLKPLNYKVNNFGVRQLNSKVTFNKHCKTQIINNYAKLIKTTKSKLLSLGYVNTISTMQNSVKQQNKANLRIINAKQFNIDLLNNIVKIPNKKYNKNLFNFKIFSIKKYANYYLINKKYFVYEFNNNVYVSLNLINNINYFNSFFKQFFLIKFYVNKKVNNLINNVLPQKILAEYKSQFNFQPFLTWINQNKQNQKSHVFKYYNMLAHYGISNYFDNKLSLCKPSFANKSVLVVINNNQIIIKNNSGKYSVMFNGIEYNNINYLNLNNTKTFVKNNAL